MTTSFKSSWFEGSIPKDVISLGVMRIEHVVGATAVTHQSGDEPKTVRYEIVRNQIHRPERDRTRQFLVVGVGCRLTFESAEAEVGIAGTVAGGNGSPVTARECVAVPTAATSRRERSMIKLRVVKLIHDEVGITVGLYDPEGIASRFEVFCPKKVPELHDWAAKRSLGDTVELAVPWSGSATESTP